MHTVLVVEDSPCAREVVLRLLKHEGYNAVGASCASEAINALRQTPTDLMLLDVMMPETDGFTLLAGLRASPDFKDLPVIMLTALSDEERMARARELGVKAYLIKSRFSFDDLMAQISNIVRPHSSPVQ